MKKGLITSILALTFTGLQAQPLPATPKLVVTLTIDQLRTGGLNYVSINVGMDMNPVPQILQVIAGYRATIAAYPDKYVQVSSVADIATSLAAMAATSCSTGSAGASAACKRVRSTGHGGMTMCCSGPRVRA